MLLDSAPVLILAQHLTARGSRHEEVSERPCVPEQPFAFTRRQLLPVFGKLDDHAGLERPVRVKCLTRSGQPGNQARGEFWRDRDRLGRQTEHPLQLPFLVRAVRRVDDQEVHKEHLGHQLLDGGRGVFELALELVEKRVFRFVWSVKKPLAQLAQPLASPDAGTRSEERIVVPKPAVDPGGGSGVDRLSADSSGAHVCSVRSLAAPSRRCYRQS